MRGQFFGWKLMVPILLVAELGMAQVPKPGETLTVKGYAGNVPVIQVEGKSYVEVEALARLINGTVGFQANGITLTLSASTSTPPPPERPKTGFSPEFLRAVIEEMAAIREWRVALVDLIEHSYPLGDDPVGGYRRTADSRLELAFTAVATDADRSGAPLVSNEFAKMQQLSDKYLAMRKSMTFVAPDSAENDPLNQQILSCARSLASWPTGGQFQDVETCH